MDQGNRMYVQVQIKRRTIASRSRAFIEWLVVCPTEFMCFKWLVHCWKSMKKSFNFQFSLGSSKSYLKVIAIYREKSSGCLDPKISRNLIPERKTHCYSAFPTFWPFQRIVGAVKWWCSSSSKMSSFFPHALQFPFLLRITDQTYQG